MRGCQSLKQQDPRGGRCDFARGTCHVSIILTRKIIFTTWRYCRTWIRADNISDPWALGIEQLASIQESGIAFRSLKKIAGVLRLTRICSIIRGGTRYRAVPTDGKTLIMLRPLWYRFCRLWWFAFNVCWCVKICSRDTCQWCSRSRVARHAV